ncbi:hypothetical protein AB4Z52_36040, partial [Rhizobium sp. 2YAF20]|uniref:hypothetical protein n=1 Tax=Rhizobium sp. 2YAF20 TaxID=3233027 RepID=UPI003F9CE8DF
MKIKVIRMPEECSCEIFWGSLRRLHDCAASRRHWFEEETMSEKIHPVMKSVKARALIDQAK